MAEAALEAGRADDLLGAVELRRDAEAALARRPGDRLVPGAAGRVGRAPTRRGAAPTRSSGAVRWKPARPRRVKSSRGRFRGRRSGSRRRTETTVEPAARAFSHSVAAAIPAPRTSTRSRVRVRPVGVHDAGSRSSSSGTFRPGWPGASRTWREDAVALDVEAALDGANALDARAAKALVPAGALADLGDVLEELLDGRVDTGRRRRGAGAAESGAAAPRGRRGRGRSSAPQWPSLSERIRRCRIAAARTRHAPAGSGSVPNTAISPGSSPPFRRVAYAHRPASPPPTIAHDSVTVT